MCRGGRPLNTRTFKSGGRPAIEAACQVGNRVVQELLTGWSRYRDVIPGT